MSSTIYAAAALTAIGMAVALHAGGRSESQAIEPRGGNLPAYQDRFGRPRPVVAVVGYNPSTELTDFVVPYGVLAQSGVAEVLALSTSAGQIQMSPSLRFGAHATLGEFDRQFPSGADYVVVPNIYAGKNHEPLLDWLRSQSARGATIVGICDGVPTLANAGLLHGRRATTHWNTIDHIERKHPGTLWLRNTRYVADGNIVTTSGVSASVPIAIALVEAIAGRERARAVAASMGATDWSPRHNSAQFRLTPGGFLAALGNKLAFWSHHEFGIDVAAGSDEIRIALLADAYGRTRRSIALTVARSSETIGTKGGLALFPDRSTAFATAPARRLSILESMTPMQVLNHALQTIATEYGTKTAEFVALTMEYEWRDKSALPATPLGSQHDSGDRS